MASNIPVIVQGNSFSLAIPLQIYYINGDQMDLQDYTPDPTDEVSVQLKGSRRNYTYTPTIDGNVANIDLSGNELADNYSVVVTIVKQDGKRLRSFRTDQFFIVESSDDLTQDDIIAGLEENVIYLNAQAFIAGADGRGIEGIQKTGTSGLVDTYTIYYTDNTTSTFQVTNGANGQAGVQGADGVGITSIEKTGTSGLVDTYTITLSNGQTSTFEVTNGRDGVDLGLATIVNNLVEGGATNVLSAEQGKDLADLLKINATFPMTGYINTSGIYKTSTNYALSMHIPVNVGDILIFTGNCGTSGIPVTGYDGTTYIGALLTHGNYVNQMVVVPNGYNNIRVCARNDAPYSLLILRKYGDILDNAFIDTEFVPTNSQLNLGTTVTSSSAGVWASWKNCTLSRASDGVGVKFNVSNEAFSGVRAATLLAQYTQSDIFTIVFEARRTTNALTKVAFYLNAGANEQSFECELTDAWERYIFENVVMSDDYTDGRVTICNPSDDINAPFEMRNLKIMKSSRMTDIELDVEKIGNIDTLINKLKGKKVSIMGDSISTCASNNAVQFTVLASDITNNRTLQAYPTKYDIGTTIGGVSVTSAMVGVLTSFSPVSGDEGKTIGKPNNYNTYAPDQLWWGKLADRLGATILQNVSWSGASVCSHEGDNANYKTSYAWHDAQIAKLATRDVEGNTINPDIVIIYRGTNDLSHTPYAKLTNFGASAMSIPSDDIVTGGFGFKEAYALTISKIRAAYPQAMIICCTLNVFKRVNYSAFPTNNGTNTLPEFNNAIREVADMMGCSVIEFDKDGITFENCYPTYIDDSAITPTHPNLTGHAKMAEKAINDVLKM